MRLRQEFTSSPDGAGDWIVRISDQSEWGDYRMEGWEGLGLPFFGPLSECPSEILDMEYSDGYGAPERPVFTAWTTNFILTCTEYDGSTGTEWSPRNPTPYVEATTTQGGA